jgi:4-amino-4-deoxy-L-arabinose transferase-like glycosyltransferase
VTIATTATGAEHGARWPAVLTVGLGALLAVRLVALALNRTDLFFDEAQYWSWSLEPALGYYSKPPLIAWLIGLSTTVCGTSEFCVRLPSPLLHTATAVAIYALANRLYPERPQFGVWSAFAFATLPGVSLSSGIISTDVPLLLCWAVALWALAAMIDDKFAWWPAVVLGVALGLGLNAKYAMAYFVLCFGVLMAIAPRQRRLLRDPRLWIAIGLGVALILPNLAWNASHSFATFAHTADNAKWTGSLFRPGKALEFFAAQFGVMGPVLFWVLLAVSARAVGLRGAPDRVLLLLSFSLPIIAIVTTQAFISRAHANWAAPAYVSATVLAVAMLMRDPARRALKTSFAIHVAVLAMLVIAVALAGRIALPGGHDPFARTLGWKELAAATAAKLAAARSANKPFGSVITDERAATAELLYYMRAEPTPVLAWFAGGRPHDHYELKRPFTTGSPEPVLLVSLRRDTTEIAARFEHVHVLGTADLPAGTTTRRVTFLRFEGFKGFGDEGRPHVGRNPRRMAKE